MLILQLGKFKIVFRNLSTFLESNSLVNTSKLFLIVLCFIIVYSTLETALKFLTNITYGLNLIFRNRVNLNLLQCSGMQLFYFFSSVTE